MIHLFDNDCALLTDTGVVNDNSPTKRIVYMNLYSKCIISLVHDEIPEGLKKCFGSNFENISGSLFLNDEKVLAGYNKICVKAAKKTVFSGSTEILGVKVLGEINVGK